MVAVVSGPDCARWVYAEAVGYVSDRVISFLLSTGSGVGQALSPAGFKCQPVLDQVDLAFAEGRRKRLPHHSETNHTVRDLAPQCQSCPLEPIDPVLRDA